MLTVKTKHIIGSLTYLRKIGLLIDDEKEVYGHTTLNAPDLV